MNEKFIVCLREKLKRFLYIGFPNEIETEHERSCEARVIEVLSMQSKSATKSIMNLKAARWPFAVNKTISVRKLFYVMQPALKMK